MSPKNNVKTNAADRKERLNRGVMPVIILTIICLICGGLLAFTNAVTAEAREANRVAMINENRLLLYEDADNFVSLDDDAIREQLARSDQYTEGLKVEDASGQFLGYLFQTWSKGYGGTVPVMTAISPDGKISGIRILSNEETAGLGKKVEDSAFRNGFIDIDATVPGVSAARSIPQGYVPVEAVSGATVSSNAVADAVTVALDAWRICGGAE